MKIAVTAASGQLGSTIVRALKKDLPADKIVAIARTPQKAEDLEVIVRQGDYNDKDSFVKALAGVDAVLIISANGNPLDRIQMHRNIIEAAKETGVKKIVYTSISGNFGPIVESNRQTEADIRDCGLDYVIGRNGLYIEPDVEYIETYKELGKIVNCAGDGKAAYTTREELAYAYSRMLLEDQHNGQTYTLAGEAISQYELCDYLNHTFDTNLYYEAMSVEAYTQDRTDELGPFMGEVIAAIYASIRKGDFDIESDYAKATGRPHMSWEAYFQPNLHQ
ncbi:MAG: SDR family oxidoreductase [Bacteroidia bacterium]